MAHEHRPHPPSPRKLKRARERGDVPRSPLASASLVLLAGGAAVALAAPGWIDAWVGFAGRALTGEGTIEEASALAARGLVVPLATVTIAAVVAGLAQVGPLVAPRAIAPDPSRLDPAAGLRRVFGGAGLASRLGPLVVVGILLGIALWVARQILPGVAGRPDATAADALGWAGFGLGALFTRAGGLLVVADVVALAYGRNRHNEEHRMSRREVRQEERETHGAGRAAAAGEAAP